MPDEEKEVSMMRRHSMNGRPLGSDLFTNKLEKGSGERLRALLVGRPKKNGINRALPIFWHRNLLIISLVGLTTNQERK